MFYALTDGGYRQPKARGEKATCPLCKQVLTAVIPVQNEAHWRHKAGDCDPWSEPEGPWHLGWKELFPTECREKALHDQIEGHRADIFIESDLGNTILEIQNSSISISEIEIRERFYSKFGRMFWLVNIGNTKTNHIHAFNLGYGMHKTKIYKGREYFVFLWVSRNYSFIRKWKQARGYVFFDVNGFLFYLANAEVSRRIGVEDNQIAVLPLGRDLFLKAVSEPKS